MSSRVRLAIVLCVTAVLSVAPVVVTVSLLGDRNCAVEYCGPGWAVWVGLVYPVVLAIAAAAAVRSWVRSGIRRGVPLLIAAATVVPLGVYLVADLYRDEWTPNVEGDQAWTLAILLPLWAFACWAAAGITYHRRERGTTA